MRALLAPLFARYAPPQTTQDLDDLQNALFMTAFGRMRRLMAGLRAYQQAEDVRILDEAPVVWQAGTTRLRLYQAEGASPNQPALLVIPSLVNRFEILDLDRDHSFLRALAQAGFRVYVLDWDAPGDEEKNFSITDYVRHRLIPALDLVQTANAGTPPAVIGYCMGGVMAVALAAVKPESVGRLGLLATPWDFSRERAWGDGFAEMMARCEPIFQRSGVLPVAILQSLFVYYQPVEVLRKYLRLAETDAVGRRFVLTEDWLNDGVPLAAPVAMECFGGWYGQNLPGTLAWRVADRVVDPTQLTCPAYVVIPLRDKVVPPESSFPLAASLPRATVSTPDLGHVGLMASTAAPELVWEPLAKWLKDFDA